MQALVKHRGLLYIDILNPCHARPLASGSAPYHTDHLSCEVLKQVQDDLNTYLP